MRTRLQLVKVEAAALHVTLQTRQDTNQMQPDLSHATSILAYGSIGSVFEVAMTISFVC